MGKISLPLSRLLYSQPRMVTAWPSCRPTSAIVVIGACVVVSISSNLTTYYQSACVGFTAKGRKERKGKQNTIDFFSLASFAPFAVKHLDYSAVTPALSSLP